MKFVIVQAFFWIAIALIIAFDLSLCFGWIKR